jgi:DHA2 family multidrug resistance protein
MSIVNLKVLKDTNLRIGTIMCFILGLGCMVLLIIPIYNNCIRWSALDAGLLLIQVQSLPEL